MKTHVLLLLCLFSGLAIQAQPKQPVPTECRTCSTPLRACCCESPDEPGLLRILAPELSAQCPQCTLLSVSQCRLTESDIAMQRSRLRYTLRNPDGVVSTHITTMTLTPAACPPGRRWHLVLYPAGDPAPSCDPAAL
jgi:hypothetical protein